MFFFLWHLLQLRLLQLQHDSAHGSPHFNGILTERTQQIHQVHGGRASVQPLRRRTIVGTCSGSYT